MQIKAPDRPARMAGPPQKATCCGAMIMSREEIADLVRGALTSVAPESENQPIEPEADFRDQMDLDSMDFLNFVIALHEATGVDIPEKDYPQLANLNGCIDYLAARLGR
jgi:acyl carrier protein